MKRVKCSLFFFQFLLVGTFTLMFLTPGLSIVERCQTRSHIGQKPFLHLKTLMGQMSASLECMFKSMDLTALSLTRGKDVLEQ